MIGLTQRREDQVGTARDGQRHDAGTSGPATGSTPSGGSPARTTPPSVVRSATCGAQRATATRARSRTRSTTAPPTTAAGCTATPVCPNHALRLLVDGGTFNGGTVPGIGLDKAAHIYWRAQSAYLTPTSDFADHADALDAACARPDRRPITAMSHGARGPTATSSPRITRADCTSVDAESRRPCSCARADPVQLQADVGRTRRRCAARAPGRGRLLGGSSRTVSAGGAGTGVVVFPRRHGARWRATRRFRSGRAGRRRSPRHPTGASVTAARRTSPRATR